MARIKDPELMKMQCSDGRAAVDQLKRMLPDLIPTLSEREFVGYYLPILTARNLKDDKGNVVPVDLGHWLAVVGNPFTPCNVLDDNGQVLYQVPPLLSTGKTTTKPKGELSLAAKSDLYAKELESNPRLDVRGLSDAFFQRLGHIEANAERDQWLAILKRYNLTHTLIGVDAAPNSLQLEEAKSPTSFIENVEEWSDF